MMTRFLLFGVVGWCMEVLWTGLGSLFRGDFTMKSNTSIWMFFIYGSGALFGPLMNALSPFPLFARGLFYVVLIFAVELAAGYTMKRLDVCPWDYSEAKLNVLGVIRLDYAPVWFCVGLLFEFMHIRMDSFIPL